MTALAVLGVLLSLTAGSFKLYQNLPSSEIKPFTGEWYKRCAEKYRSFDPKTGLFTSYRGKKIFCRFRRR